MMTQREIETFYGLPQGAEFQSLRKKGLFRDPAFVGRIIAKAAQSDWAKLTGAARSLPMRAEWLSQADAEKRAAEGKSIPVDNSGYHVAVVSDFANGQFRNER